jgi:hypothetical protein
LHTGPLSRGNSGGGAGWASVDAVEVEPINLDCRR